jgi:hypothetical protein
LSLTYKVILVCYFNDKADSFFVGPAFQTANVSKYYLSVAINISFLFHFSLDQIVTDCFLYAQGIAFFDQYLYHISNLNRFERCPEFAFEAPHTDPF